MFPSPMGFPRLKETVGGLIEVNCNYMYDRIFVDETYTFTFIIHDLNFLFKLIYYMIRYSDISSREQSS